MKNLRKGFARATAARVFVFPHLGRGSTIDPNRLQQAPKRLVFMSTPTGLNLALTADDITQAFHNAQEEREAETPRFEHFANFHNVYKYKCEVKHSSLSPEEINRVRRIITNIKYWQAELDFCRSEFEHMVFEKLLRKHGIDGISTSDLVIVRKLGTAYRKRLAANGLRSDAFLRKRMAIPNQSYWQIEAAPFQREADIREQAVLAKLDRRGRRKKTDPQPKSPQRSKRIAERIANDIKVPSSRRKHRPTPTPLAPFPLSGRVAKHKSGRPRRFAGQSK